MTRLRTRVKLVVFALAFAMATNWLRIFIIAIAGHLTDMQHHLVATSTTASAGYMFAVTMVMIFPHRAPLAAHRSAAFGIRACASVAGSAARGVRRGPRGLLGRRGRLVAR